MANKEDVALIAHLMRRAGFGVHVLRRLVVSTEVRVQALEIFRLALGAEGRRAMFGIDVPIFAFSHCRDVVVEVSKAGGMGVLGMARMIGVSAPNVSSNFEIGVPAATEITSVSP